MVVDLFKKRKDDLLKFLKLDKLLKDNYDQLFFLLFLIFLGINIYYFTKTFSQALWFDEADYLNFAKSVAFGFPKWALGPVRPPLFSLVGALFFKIGLGEICLRVLIMIFGLANIILMYLIGKEIDCKKVGLIAAIALASFWSHLFYSFRLIVDVPVLTLWLLAVYFFVRGYINNKNDKLVIWLGPIVFIGFLIKYLNALIGIILIVYLLITERLNFLKDKRLWKSFFITAVLLLAFFATQYIFYGSPFAFLKASLVNRTIQDKSFAFFFVGGIQQLLSPVMLGWIFFALFIVGLGIVCQIFLGLDILVKNKDKSLNKKLFLLLWVLFVLLFLAKLGFDTFIEERYAFNLFVAVFLVGAIGFVWLYDAAKKYNKEVVVIFSILLIIVGVYENISKADSLIKVKAQSFIEVKEAGQFLEDHLAKDEGYLSPATSAEIQYHSNRKNMGDDAEAALNNTKIKYAVFSAYNPMPEGYIKFIQEHQSNFKPVVAYFLPVNKQQPVVVVFEIVRS